MAELPPLPPGFTLDQPQQALPPLPPGFTLDSDTSAAPASTIGRTAGLAMRGVAEGATSAGTFAADTMLNNPGVASMLPPPFNLISSAMGGVDVRRGGAPVATPVGMATGNTAQSFQNLAEQAATRVGAPVPRTTGENLLYAGSKGVGAGLTGGVASGASAANVVRAGVSGATGATAAEGVKLAGGGPLLQLGAGIAGGLAPSVLESAGRGVGALVSPFFNRGRENIAGRVLAADATNPAAAQAALENPSQAVPGSAPTTAEITRDPGLAQLQTRLRSLEPDQFNTADSARHAAREALLDSMDSTPPQVRALETKREAVTTPLRDAAFKQALGKEAPTADVITRIDELLADPENAGKSVQSALKDVRAQIEGQTDARALYAVRKEINRILEGRYIGADESVLRYAGKQLGAVKGAIDNAINAVAPGFKNYLKAYSDLSKPIDRAQTLVDIRSRTGLASSDLATGAERLSQAKWRQVVSQSADELSKTLTPEEMANLKRIAADLDRGAAVAAAGNTPGSSTAANLVAKEQLSVANLLGQSFGIGMKQPPPLIGTLMRPLAWMYQLPEGRIRQLIVDAMLDPKLARSLMARATSQNVMSVADRWAALIRPSAAVVASNSPESATVPAQE
jgi:hypothetical protein